MWNLVKKDLVINRNLLLFAALFGWALVPLASVKTGGELFGALYLQILVVHLLHMFGRGTGQMRRESVLLNSLPLKKSSIVTGKYTFLLLCCVANALYLSLISAAMPFFGVTPTLPLWPLFLILSLAGILYAAILLPFSFLSPPIASVATVVFYFVVTLIPQQIPRWFGAITLADLFSRLQRSQLVLMKQMWLLIAIVLLVILLFVSWRTSIAFDKKTVLI